VSQAGRYVCNAIFPSHSCLAFTSTPFSSSNVIALIGEFSTTWCRAVMPSKFCFDGSAPAAMSNHNKHHHCLHGSNGADSPLTSTCMLHFAVSKRHTMSSFFSLQVCFEFSTRKRVILPCLYLAST